MNRKLLKTLMIASALFMGTTSLWADDDEEVTYQLLKTIDFEDASTYSTDWTFSNGTMSQQTRTDGTYFMHLYSGDSNRSAYYVVNTTTLSNYFSATQWKVTFELAAVPSYSYAASFYFQAADKSTNLFYLTAASASSKSTTGLKATVYDASGTSTDATITLDSASWDASPTLSTFYTFTVVGSADAVTLSIADADGNAILTDKEVATSNTATDLHLGQFYFYVARYYGCVGIDNIQYYIVSDNEIVATPTATITKVNGTERTITMSCETENTTIYYSTTEDGEATAYAEPITIS